MTKIKNNDNNNCWQGDEQTKISYTAGGNAKWYSHSEKQFGGLFKNHTVIHNPVFMILGIYRTEMKIYVDTKIC